MILLVKLTLSVNLNVALIMGKIEEREKIQQRTSNAATCAFKVQGRDMEKIKDPEKSQLQTSNSSVTHVPMNTQ